MSQYELANLASGTMGNFLTAFTVYLTVITAYIAAAFIAGSRLTRLQLLIVNAAFLIATGVLGYLVPSIFARFVAVAKLNREFVVDGSPPLVDFTVALAALVVILAVGSLVFMYTVRNSAQDPG